MSPLEPRSATLAGIRGMGYVLQVAHTRRAHVEQVEPTWDYVGSFSADHDQDIRPLMTSFESRQETTFEGTVYLRDRTSLVCTCPVVLKEIPLAGAPWRFHVARAPTFLD